jgi:hypothetical protein
MRASAAVTTLLIGSTATSWAPRAAAHQAAPLLPRWQPSWQINQSTIVMTCNQSGYSTAANVSKFAIVDYDVRSAARAAVCRAAALPLL